MKRTIVLVVVAGGLGCGSDKPPPPPPPKCGPSAASPSLVMGQSTGLDARASDPDGDTLAYSWAQTAPASPQGSFSSLTSATPTWTAPTVAQTTPFALAVTVSDGKGSSTTCPVKVFAKTSTDPSFIADVQPLLVRCFGGCHIAPDGSQPLTFYDTLITWTTVIDCKGQPLIKPGDPDNSPLFKMIAGLSCGHQMPPGGPYLGTDDLNLVHTWISQGAADN